MKNQDDIIRIKVLRADFSGDLYKKMHCMV